jgi:hypothetical protein
VIPAIQHFMTVSSTDLIPCRCRATECAGLLISGLVEAGSSGRTTAASLAPWLMETGLAGFNLPTHELREYTHGMFATVAKASTVNTYIKCFQTFVAISTTCGRIQLADS